MTYFVPTYSPINVIVAFVYFVISLNKFNIDEHTLSVATHLYFEAAKGSRASYCPDKVTEPTLTLQFLNRSPDTLVCDINVMHSLNTIAQHASGSHEYKINN
jgi:hypothetical protein